MDVLPFCWRLSIALHLLVRNIWDEIIRCHLDLGWERIENQKFDIYVKTLERWMDFTFSFLLL